MFQTPRHQITPQGRRHRVCRDLWFGVTAIMIAFAGPLAHSQSGPPNTCKASGQTYDANNTATTCMAWGQNAEANAGSIAIGANAVSTYAADAQGQPTGFGVAIGVHAKSSYAVALGNNATSASGVAVGNNASSTNGTAMGVNAQATNGIAIGAGAKTSSVILGTSIALGDSTNALGDRSVAIGQGARTSAGGTGNIAIGFQASTGTAWDSIAIGEGSSSTGPQSLALGPSAQATAAYSVALGSGSIADGTSNQRAAYNPSNGTIAGATPIGEVSLGTTSTQRRLTHVAAGADDTDAVNVSQLKALSSNAVQYGDDTHASVMLAGSAGTRISNVMAGIADSDATNLGQLSSIASALGGGAGFTKGVWSNPTFALQGGSYTTVRSAMDAVDASLTTINHRIDTIQLTPGPKGDTGATGPQGQPGNTGATGPQGNKGDTGAKGDPGTSGSKGDRGDTGATGPQGPTGATGATGPKGDTGAKGDAGSGSDALAVHYDTRDQSSITLQGAGGTHLSNVAAGTAANDAVNVSQLNRQTQQAIQTANAYADAGDRRTLDAANHYTDQRVDALRSQWDDRFRATDQRISRVGAVTSAMGLMAGTAASLPMQDTLAMSVAGYRGQSAIAIGLNHHISDRIAITIGGAFSAGGESTLGAGIAIGLR